MRSEVSWGFGAIAVGLVTMVAPLKFKLAPTIVDVLFWGGLIASIALIGLAVIPFGKHVVSDARSAFKPKKVKDWRPYHDTESFRLGQWAALITGHEYHPDPRDDPGYRPWRHTFFGLKRAIENGSFVIAHQEPVTRTTLVSRKEIAAYYLTHRTERPAVIFRSA